MVWEQGGSRWGRDQMRDELPHWAEGRMTREATSRDRRRREGGDGSQLRRGRDRGAARVFLLYAVTLAPSTAMWDTSEYIAAAYVSGIPHPPGNPFFVLLGHVFTVLPIAPTIAQRVNVMAALTSAASAGIWFLVTERVLGGWLDARWLRSSVRRPRC